MKLGGRKKNRTYKEKKMGVAILNYQLQTGC